MIQAYEQLHAAGFAHSVEVWTRESKLAGGLYGVALGHCYFGESMFFKESNASKFGFIKLVEMLKKKEYKLIDCQVHTQHLESLGAEHISRKSFLDMVGAYTSDLGNIGSWKEWERDL
jgi:leucyl/phenylalanyl-tRNA--protein transferase